MYVVASFVCFPCWSFIFLVVRGGKFLLCGSLFCILKAYLFVIENIFDTFWKQKKLRRQWGVSVFNTRTKRIIINSLRTYFIVLCYFIVNSDSLFIILLFLYIYMFIFYWLWKTFNSINGLLISLCRWFLVPMHCVY